MRRVQLQSDTATKRHLNTPTGDPAHFNQDQSGKGNLHAVEDQHVLHSLSSDNLVPQTSVGISKLRVAQNTRTMNFWNPFAR